MARKDLKKIMKCSKILSGKQIAGKHCLKSLGETSLSGGASLRSLKKFYKEKKLMRNFKKFLALVLATLMVVSAAATVSAYSDVADDNIYAAAIDALTEYGIVNGTSEDVYSPDADVLRFQMALMMARALEPEVKDWNDGLAVFTDVNEWYGAIAYAYTNNIVTGIGNGLFAPRAGIRYQDALIMAVRALGYDVDTTCDPYWIEAYKIAGNIGLTNGVKVTDPAKTLTRAETAQVIYNMLKATPADGGATIEEKNFGFAGANNVTTVIVTATEKQQYDENAKPAEAGYVGVQVVANGIPTGEVKYYPAALLGIESDKIENSFAHAFDLVNYDAEKGTFVKVVAGLEPVVVNGTDVAISNKTTGKITINGTAYYAVDEITGAALKNELVIYAGGSVDTTNSILVVDKNGNVYNDVNKIVATAVEINGTTLYLYDGVFHTEKEALDAFGVKIPGSAINYTTYTAEKLEDLNKNYQISLYDDNRDGKYDRATIANLYMDVYNVDGKKAKFGVMNGEEVTFTNTDLKKGDVITYTYNANTKVVNVVEVLAKESGILTKINTTNSNVADKTKSTYRSVIVTISGKEYVLANEDRMKAGFIGAEVKTTDGAKFNEIADKATMNFVNWNDLVIGDTVNFVAYGDTIIAAQSKQAGDPYDVVVANEITDITSDSIIVSAYVNGVLTNDIEVSSVKIGDTEYVFSKLNMFALSAAVNTINTNFNEHDFFQVRTKVDGTVSLTLTSADAEYNKQITATQGVLNFNSGIADNISVRDEALRTDAKTVFYFLGANNTVKVLVGSPANNKTIDLSKATVYTNKLGYGSNSYNGVSSVVVVDCGNNAITDVTNIFTADAAPTTNILILNDSALTYVKATAETLGLSGSDVYKAYNVDAINLADGSQVKTIYVKDGVDLDLVAGKAYTVEKNGFVIKSANVEVDPFTTNDNFDRDDIVAARVWTIDNNAVNNVKFTNAAKYDLKTNPYDVIASGKTYTLKYVIVGNNNNKTIIGIAYEKGTTVNNDPVGTKKVNATWTDNGGSYVAFADDTSAKTAEISGKVYVGTLNGATIRDTYKWRDDVATNGKWTGLKAGVADKTVAAYIYAEDNTTVKYGNDGLNVTATVDEAGVCTFSIKRVNSTPDAFNGEKAQTFEKGNYFVRVCFDSYYFLIPVTVG